MSDEFTLALSYRIEIRNETDEVITPCLYWTVPHQTSLRSVAWFAATAAPTTRLVRDFQYVPGMFYTPRVVTTGEPIVLGPELISPVVFGFNNSVRLSCASGRYAFGTPQPYASPDMLHLLQDDSVRDEDASVGFSIDGQAALVTIAAANATLDVPMALRLNIGLASVPQGAILDASQLRQATPIRIPQNVQAMYVAYEDNDRLALSQYAPRQDRTPLLQAGV